MCKIKGPAICLGQFLRDEQPYDNLENICKWVAGLGYKGVQIPANDARVIDLDKATEVSFHHFGGAETAPARNRSILGLE